MQKKLHISFVARRPLTRKEQLAKEQQKAVDIKKQESKKASIEAAVIQAEAEREAACIKKQEMQQRVEHTWAQMVEATSRRVQAARCACVHSTYKEDKRQLQLACEVLLRCDQGDVVRKRHLPAEHCEVLHVKGQVLTLRNPETRQRETAPVNALLLIHRVAFEISVFSVEESCNKTVGGLDADMTLQALLQQVRHEFGLGARQKVQLMHGDRNLSTESCSTPLGKAGLGLRNGAQLALNILNRPFPLLVSDLAGALISIPDVYLDSPLVDVHTCVNRMKGIQREGFGWQLLLGTRTFRAGDYRRTLGDLGIHEGSVLTCIRSSICIEQCPKCANRSEVVCDVMMGATHEGWGRRWNRCEYKCLVCEKDIGFHEYVSACNACKGFWHGDCH